MATNNLLLTLHPLHPDWTAAQFADVAGCDLSYVRKTFSLAGLKIKDSRRTVQEW